MSDDHEVPLSLYRTETMVLSKEAAAEFVAALMSDFEPNERLKRAAAEYRAAMRGDTGGNAATSD